MVRFQIWDKQWKVRTDYLEKFVLGRLCGLSGFPWAVQPPRTVSLPDGPPEGNFSRQSLRTLNFLSEFSLLKPKKMQPRVALWACLVIRLSWGAQPQRTVWLPEEPPEGPDSPHYPQGFSTECHSFGIPQVLFGFNCTNLTPRVQCGESVCQ